MPSSSVLNSGARLSSTKIVFANKRPLVNYRMYETVSKRLKNSNDDKVLRKGLKSHV